MAFVFCRESQRRNTYYVGYYLDGRFVRKRVGRSKVFADKVKGDVEARLERREAHLLPRDYPVLGFFDEYRRRTEPRHSAGYRKRLKSVVENIKRFLREKRPYLTKLSQLRPAVGEEYQRHRLTETSGNAARPVTRRTINIEVSSLKTMLNQAVKWDMLSENPMTAVEYLKEEDSKKVRALTEEEVQRLLDAASGWFRPVLLTAIYSGLREGELITLEWDDVDFDVGALHIRGKLGWIPKSSGRSVRERDVAIPKDLTDYLRELKEASRHKDNWVFHNKDGEQLKPGLRKALMALTRKCGFREVTQFHALRHTYATHLIKACKDVTVAQAQLGHADIRTTMKYSDVTEDRKRKAAQMLHFGTPFNGMPP